MMMKKHCHYDIMSALYDSTSWSETDAMALCALMPISHIETTGSLDSKVHGANMGPIWGWQDPGGPHVGPMNFAIWESKWTVKSMEKVKGHFAGVHCIPQVVWIPYPKTSFERWHMILSHKSDFIYSFIFFCFTMTRASIGITHTRLHQQVIVFPHYTIASILAAISTWWMTPGSLSITWLNFNPSMDK